VFWTQWFCHLHLFFKKALPFFSTVKNSLPRTLAKINWQPYKNLALTAKHISYFLIEKTTSTDKWITRADSLHARDHRKMKGMQTLTLQRFDPQARRIGLEWKPAQSTLPAICFPITSFSSSSSQFWETNQIDSTESWVLAQKRSKWSKPNRRTEAEKVYNPPVCRLPSKLANESSNYRLCEQWDRNLARICCSGVHSFKRLKLAHGANIW
jgi:hypothetical protein